MKHITLLCALLALVISCKQKPGKPFIPRSGEGAAEADPGDEVEDSSHQLFNLAQNIADNPGLENLHKNIADGNAYIFFGEKRKVRAESNFTVEAAADDETGGKTITAAYFLDGYAFSRNLAEADGHVIDFGTIATIATPATMETHVRIMGADLFVGDAEGIVDQNFVRDFPFEASFYPIPLAALTIGGKVGGEIGLHSELGVRQDNAMQLVFIPRVSLTVGITSGIKLIEILRAQAQGVMKLVELKLRNSASLGLVEASDYLYGNIGIEGGTISALDGKIMLTASAGLIGLKRLAFEALISKLGYGQMFDLSWSYPLFDPEPIVSKDMPGHTKAFMKFYKQPVDRADCLAKVKGVSDHLEKHIEGLNAFADTEEPEDRKVTDSALGNLKEIAARVKVYCK